MKKILSIFALVLCAITLPLGLVGCKKAKQNGPEYIIGKTYTFKSVESNGFTEDEIAEIKNDFSSHRFSFTENAILISRELNEDFSTLCYYKINKDRTLTTYKDEKMTTLSDFNNGLVFYFSKDYKKFYYKVVEEDGGKTFSVIFAC